MDARSKVEHIYQRMKVEDRKVRAKAEEFVRLLDHRLAHGSGLGSQISTCKYAVCVHLACKLHGFEFNRATILQLLAVNGSAYGEAYTTVSSLLGVKPTVSIRAVCTKLGRPELGPVAEKTLNLFKERYIAGLPEPRRKDANFSSPAFEAASIALAAAFRKMTIDQKQLLELCEVNQKDFKLRYDAIDELIFAPQRELSAKKAFEEKEKRELEEKERKEKEEERRRIEAEEKKKRIKEGLEEEEREESDYEEDLGGAKMMKAKKEKEEKAEINSRLKEEKEMLAELGVSPSLSDALPVPAPFPSSAPSLHSSINQSLLLPSSDVASFSARTLAELEEAAERGKVSTPAYQAEMRAKEEFEKWKEQNLKSAKPTFAPTKQSTLDFLLGKKTVPEKEKANQEGGLKRAREEMKEEKEEEKPPARTSPRKKAKLGKLSQ